MILAYFLMGRQISSGKKEYEEVSLLMTIHAT
jgi:hypothetical protein